MTYTGWEEFRRAAQFLMNARQHASITTALLLTANQATLSGPAGSWHQFTSCLLSKLELSPTINWIAPAWVSAISYPVNCDNDWIHYVRDILKQQVKLVCMFCFYVFADCYFWELDWSLFCPRRRLTFMQAISRRQRLRWRRRHKKRLWLLLPHRDHHQ